MGHRPALITWLFLIAWGQVEVEEGGTGKYKETNRIFAEHYCVNHRDLLLEGLG